MNVFLSEYLTCGAFSAPTEDKRSLAVEGAAMLRALAADAVAAGCEVSITWDPACGEFGVKNVTVHDAGTAEDEERLFRGLARTADTTLVIAPEFDGILEERCRLIAACGGRTAGSSSDAIALCADKLRLAEHLAANGVATIGAEPWQMDDAALALKRAPPFPLVVKPRFGAGSLHSFLLTSVEDLQQTEAEQSACGMELIAQAFIAGQPLSVAAIVSRNGIEMFPVCTQNVRGKRLEYAGGMVPALVERADAVAELARRAIASVAGLRGYVGVDLILPSDGPPVVVEINPRLTSSYHGYRRLAKTNLAPRVLQPDAEARPLAWHKTPISFLADGTAFAEDEVSKSPS